MTLHSCFQPASLTPHTAPLQTDDVLSWMNSNKFMMNTDKTKVMAVGASSRLSLVDSNSAEVGVGNISFKTSVKYLGVKTGQPLFIQDPIISVCRASSVELRSLASIRPYLSNSTYARLVTALITSRLVIATQCWLVCLWNRQVDCRGVRTVQHGLFFFVSGIT